MYEITLSLYIIIRLKICFLHDIVQELYILKRFVSCFGFAIKRLHSQLKQVILCSLIKKHVLQGLLSYHCSFHDIIF
jgi:hypothetical protein